MNSPGVFADLPALRACWHPVAFASEVSGRPVPASLLGEPLVIWRGAGGTPRAMSDLCVHRGGALSAGWTSDPFDRIIVAHAHANREAPLGACPRNIARRA